MALNLKPKSNSSVTRRTTSNRSALRTVSPSTRKGSTTKAPRGNGSRAKGSIFGGARSANSYTTASRTPQKRAATNARVPSVKGRPSQNKSVRRSASATSVNDAYGAAGFSRSQYGSNTPHLTRNQPNDAQVANQPLRSVSVSQVRSQAKTTFAKRTIPFKGIAAVLIVVAVVVGVTLAVLSTTNVFPVEEVTVSGVTHLTAEELTDLAAVPEGATLLNVDANGISSRLTTNPWVQSVTVDRIFPNTLNLNVTERSISAIVEVTVDNENHVQTWALASDGMWLMQIPDKDSEEAKSVASAVYEDAEKVLHINDIPYGSTPEAGSYCSNANVENALGIIDGMTTELKDQVKTVSAFSGDSTTLTLESGVEIAFGDKNNIRDKERVCLQLMEEHPSQISYINVRSVNNPVWRSL